MSFYAVGYDLKAGQDYEPLMQKLQTGFDTWWHCLDSTWVIKTAMTTSSVRDILKAYSYEGDRLLVIDVTSGPCSWFGFNEKCSTWLKDALEGRL
jgi:hypothetical protein